MRTTRVIAMAAITIVGLAALLAVRIAIAAPAEAPHQMIASVLFRQDTNEAQVRLGVVDLGPSKKYGRAIFRRGVIIADDGGRMTPIRGEAVLVAQGRTFQVFQFADVHIDMPGTKVIRVTHISFHVMLGDYAHPDFICGSPSMSIDYCLDLWKTTD